MPKQRFGSGSVFARAQRDEAFEKAIKKEPPTPPVDINVAAVPYSFDVPRFLDVQALPIGVVYNIAHTCGHSSQRTLLLPVGPHGLETLKRSIKHISESACVLCFNRYFEKTPDVVMMDNIGLATETKTTPEDIQKLKSIALNSQTPKK